MNPKIVLTTSATLLALAGIAFSFMPDEITEQMGLAPHLLFSFTFQLMGALYFGFGMLNWMSRTTTTGGIYNKPIVLANFAHFTIGSLAGIKYIFAYPVQRPAIYLLIVIYCAFSISFGIINFSPPMISKIK